MRLGFILGSEWLRMDPPENAKREEPLYCRESPNQKRDDGHPHPTMGLHLVVTLEPCCQLLQRTERIPHTPEDYMVKLTY